jgi:gliding motility-associated-like protein
VPGNDYGTQEPFSGNAYAGLVDYYDGNYREYIAVRIPSLQSGQAYRFSMYLSLGDNMAHASNGLGVLFFTDIDTTKHHSRLTATPHISFSDKGPLTEMDSWTFLCDTLYADSAYSGFAIGGFKSNDSITLTPYVPGSPYSYYYIDSVSLYHIPHLRFHESGNLCMGSRIFIPFEIFPKNYFLEDNMFKIELSDTSGNFISPITLGTIKTNTAGLIPVDIPSALYPSSKYRVRIVSTNPVESWVSDANWEIRTSPEVVATGSTPVCPGEDIYLSATSTETASYSWTGPSFSSAEPSPLIVDASPANTGDYIVTVTNNECSSKDTLHIVVNCNIIGVPSAFTPNGDGYNDILFVNGRDVAEVHLQIYNRWGELVFETRDMKTGWDGYFRHDSQEMDAVGYSLKAVFKDGATHASRGNITIIR